MLKKTLSYTLAMMITVAGCGFNIDSASANTGEYKEEGDKITKVSANLEEYNEVEENGNSMIVISANTGEYTKEGDKITKVLKYQDTFYPDGSICTKGDINTYLDISDKDEDFLVGAEKIRVVDMSKISKDDLRPPLIVKLKYHGKNKLKLNWRGGQNAAKYAVYEKTKGTGYRKVAVTSKKSYVTKKLKANRTYAYKIKSVGKDGSYSKDTSWTIFGRTHESKARNLYWTENGKFDKESYNSCVAYGGLVDIGKESKDYIIKRNGEKLVGLHGSAKDEYNIVGLRNVQFDDTQFSRLVVVTSELDRFEFLNGKDFSNIHFGDEVVEHSSDYTKFRFNRKNEDNIARKPLNYSKNKPTYVIKYVPSGNYEVRELVDGYDMYSYLNENNAL